MHTQSAAQSTGGRLCYGQLYVHVSSGALGTGTTCFKGFLSIMRGTLQALYFCERNSGPYMGINTAYTGDFFCFVCRSDRFEITGVTVNQFTSGILLVYSVPHTGLFSVKNRKEFVAINHFFFNETKSGHPNKRLFH